MAKYFPLAAERFGWSKRHVTGDPTPGPIKRGMGCAANRWGGGGKGTKAHCEINPDGSVVMRCGTQDIGVGTKTIVAMITAETLGIPMELVRPRSETATIRSAAGPAAARPPPASRRRFG